MCRLCESGYDFKRIIINNVMGEWCISFPSSKRAVTEENKIHFCPECGRKIDALGNHKED